MNLDLLIFGGGIAGLWTLLRARQAGYSVLLLESRALGGIQSIASQGIIHGGTKYALTGRLSEAAKAIGGMPGRWRACLEGKGELDLTGVRLLSPHQYLWSSGSLASAVAGFLGSRAMRSRARAVPREQLPAPFDHAGFDGALYRLEEPVLDAASLMAVLAEQAGQQCWRYSPEQLELEAGQVRIGDVGLKPRYVLLAAGAGNQGLMARLGLDQPRMQRRPLHMVMAAGALPPVYAHAMEASANPRITITSHPLPGGECVWYLGGNLAEKGVGLSPAEQIRRARRELGELLPWVDLSGLKWATLAIDRAEVATPGAKRPDDAFLSRQGQVLVTWPTKLAFAPRVADLVLEALGDSVPLASPIPELPLEKPALARLPWEVSEWS